jgi:ubiquinone biosynthesis protein
VNLLQLNRNIRSIKRYRQIIRVLFKYGFDNLLAYLNLSELIARWRRLAQRGTASLAHLSQAERMRLALEELGPTFIKLGQFLSTRGDLLPKSYVDEFSRLQDNVPPFPLDDVLAVLRQEFGRDQSEIFASFGPVSIAAASIAQVHRATLHSGEDVVVKIRRPGISELVETDIEALMLLAMVAEKHLPNADIYDPVGQIKELARTIRRELDFTKEGLTIEKFTANFSGDPTVCFPIVHWELTTKAVLTMEYIDGIKVSEIDALELAGLDLKEIARNGAGAFVRMVLQHGYFHGDPHPGNILIRPGNIICMLDFGMIGKIDTLQMQHLSDILLAILNRDLDEVISLLLYSGDLTDTINTRSFRRDLAEFIDNYYDLPLKHLEVGRMLVEFLEVVTNYRIRLHPDMMLLAKAFITIEGMGRRLDPNFDMVQYLRPLMEQEMKRRYAPRNIWRDLYSNLSSYANLARTLPKDIKEILNRLNRDKFKIDLEHRGLDHFIRELDKSANRVSSSLIIAALIVGSSIVVDSGRGPLLFGLPLFALTGYTIAGIVGLVWLIGIIRSGRL